MSRRRCRTLCGLRSCTFARQRIGLCQAGEPEALPVKGLEQDKDETTLEACTPEKHRVHARQGSGSSHSFSISELWSCVAMFNVSIEPKNLHLDTIARLVVPESRLILPPLSMHQHLCVLCFSFIILIKSPLGYWPRLW